MGLSNDRCLGSAVTSGLRIGDRALHLFLHPTQFNLQPRDLSDFVRTE